jgi:hypothetical protein
MNIIMDRFTKILFLGCCLTFVSSSVFAGDQLCSDQTDFGCNLPNAIPIVINYRQVNLPSNAKVKMIYHPSDQDWQNGQWSALSCIYGTEYNDVSNDQGDLGSAMAVSGGAGNFFCVKGLLANYTGSSTNSPITLNADSLSIPDAIINNLQNPAENNFNSYLFYIATGADKNYLEGKDNDTAKIKLYYMNALFYKDSESSYTPVRWAPGKRSTTYTEKVNSGGEYPGNLGYFQISINGTDIAKVNLTNDGNIYYNGDWSGTPSLKDMKAEASKSLTNVQVVSSVTSNSFAGDPAAKSSSNININIALACTNPTADQMEPCNTPGVSASECAIPCNSANLPVPKS